jgi:hypothetical protein
MYENIGELTWWPNDGGSSENLSFATCSGGELYSQVCLEHNLPDSSYHLPMIEARCKPEKKNRSKQQLF